MVVTPVLAVTFGPENVLRPKPGSQLYKEAPEAIKLLELPLQTLETDGVITIVGLGMMRKLVVAIALHNPLEPTTVRVAGAANTCCTPAGKQIQGPGMLYEMLLLVTNV